MWQNNQNPEVIGETKKVYQPFWWFEKNLRSRDHFHLFMVGNLSSESSHCFYLLCVLFLLEKFFEHYAESLHGASQWWCLWMKNRGCRRGYETPLGASMLTELQLHIVWMTERHATTWVFYRGLCANEIDWRGVFTRRAGKAKQLFRFLLIARCIAAGEDSASQGDNRTALLEKEIKRHWSVRLAIIMRTRENTKPYCIFSQTGWIRVCPHSHNEVFEKKGNYSYSLRTVTSEAFLEHHPATLCKLSHILFWRTAHCVAVPHQCLQESSWQCWAGWIHLVTHFTAAWLSPRSLVAQKWRGWQAVRLERVVLPGSALWALKSCLVRHSEQRLVHLIQKCRIHFEKRWGTSQL